MDFGRLMLWIDVVYLKDAMNSSSLSAPLLRVRARVVSPLYELHRKIAIVPRSQAHFRSWLARVTRFEVLKEMNACHLHSPLVLVSSRAYHNLLFAS